MERKTRIKTSRIAAFILLLLILVFGVSGLEKSPLEESPAQFEESSSRVVLILKDAVTGDSLKNYHLELLVNDGKKQTSIKRFVANEEFIEFKSEKGRLEMTAKVDDLTTEGKDSYRKFFVDVETDLQTEVVFLFPVGSVRGMVVDSLDNVVGSAKLKFDCSSQEGEPFQENTDQFGTFRNDWINKGECTVYATYGDSTGSETFEVNKGRITEVTVKLDKTLLVQKSPPWLLLLLAIAVFAAAIIIITKTAKKVRKSPKTPEDSQHKEHLKSEHSKDKRITDIIATLNKDQRTIVETLLEHGNKSSQAKIYHETGIPKTSLHRQIQVLEQKNIIQVEKLGKMKKLELTDWFLGKEQK
ncbi:helix-turn-helix transcriptional regulator [Nanoarchaeota archaeon]